MPSTAERDVDLDAPTISRAEYETQRARRRMRRPSWGAPPSPPTSDEDELSETGLLVFTAQADGTTAVASVEREAELPPAEGERSSPSSAFSFGNSQKTGGGNSPVYEVSDHREVPLLYGLTTSTSAQCASTSTTARAAAYHLAHQEELEGHDPEGSTCYEDGENSEDEESPEDDENPSGVYVWNDFLQTYVPASECDEDELTATCMPKDDSDAESVHNEDARAGRREEKEPATEPPGQLRVLLHRQTPRATTIPLPARPAGEMYPRGAHSAPPPDQGSIRAAEKQAEEGKLINLASHIYNTYSENLYPRCSAVAAAAAEASSSRSATFTHCRSRCFCALSSRRRCWLRDLRLLLGRSRLPRRLEWWRPLLSELELECLPFRGGEALPLSRREQSDKLSDLEKQLEVVEGELGVK
ncbi:hypothetical protein CYMTET_18083 [Cymbomonas tetramitiformis]|uniref:Uncharacterized protein n=1 Tax=Cymbomonas tetramitiformis TaxID=36881 RepID=A0AAE0G953_9CHLO|nr:hypothetical protein CYMTET_18083 [Cymbomonas tetramitiformis]